MPTPDAPPTTLARGTFAVAPTDVWAFRLNFENLPRYNPDVSGVRRIADGAGAQQLGPGARYGFELADPRQPGMTHPVELWIEEAEEPTLVSAGMRGASEAYEEFTVEPRPEGGCEAILRLWLFLPELPDRARELAVAGAYEQIRKEVLLMQEVLDGQAGDAR